MGSFALARPVWHCSLRAAPGDKMLSDDDWAHIAGDVMHRTGLSPYGQEDDGVRWIAVRHGADRAARARYGRIPPPTPAGNQLRQAARLLGAFTSLTHDPVLTPLLLIIRLAALAETVAGMHDTQQRAAQAAAARAAAEHLYTFTHAAPGRPPAPARPRARTAAQLAALSFPASAQPGRWPPTPEQPGEDRPAWRPVRGQSPIRPRGPSP